MVYLTVEEVDELKVYLSRARDGRIGSMSALDGLMTAIACTPDPVPTAEDYLPLVLETETGEPVFPDQVQVKRITDLLLQYFAALRASLWNSGEIIGDDLRFHYPVFDEDKRGNVFVERWFNGFRIGTKLRPGHWDRLIHTTDEDDHLLPLMLLAAQRHPDPELRSFKDPLSVDQQRELAEDAAFGIIDLYHENHDMELHPAPPDHTMYIGSGMYVRDTPKVGRNDPCPCGSGRKYKKCCARLESFR